MSRRTLIWIGSGVAVVAAALFAGWWLLLRSTAPPPVDLGDAVAAVTSSTTTTTVAGTTTIPSTTTPQGTTTTAAADTTVDGTWTVAEGSFAGYRVQEELAGIGFTTAAGRSDGVTGSLVIADGTVATVDITVDVTALRSDDSRRDGAIRRQALETNTFPTAGFTLTAPIDLPAGATDGSPFTLDATGDLTIHGVTRSVTIPLDAQFVAGRIVVVGTTHIVFADYDIDPPSAVIVLSVEDEGEMEFQLVFDAA